MISKLKSNPVIDIELSDQYKDKLSHPYTSSNLHLLKMEKPKLITLKDVFSKLKDYLNSDQIKYMTEEITTQLIP